jgi:hypothetical protein
MQLKEYMHNIGLRAKNLGAAKTIDENKKIRLCRKPKLSYFNHEEHEGHEEGF